MSELENNKIDNAVSTAKAVIGIVPWVGPLFAELIGTTIPNQRIDRLAQFSQKLENKLSEIEKEVFQQKLENEEFRDLLEAAMWQSTKASTSERKEYIASVIKNSLSEQDIELSEFLYILSLLGQINDVEVIWLRATLYTSNDEDESFREKHQNVLEPVLVSHGSEQVELDKKALQVSYKEHLTQLNLLTRKYKIDKKTKIPEYSSGGIPIIRRYEITGLGKLLLRQIGFELE